MGSIADKGAWPMGVIDSRLIRQHHSRLVLRHIFDLGARSRAQISSETGLNKTTVSSIIADLLERGLLVEGGRENSGTAGRPGTSVHASGRVVALGLQIDVDFSAVCVTDLTGRVRYSAVVPARNRRISPEQATANVADLARQALRTLRKDDPVCAGATLALPGRVDRESGRLAFAPNLGWRDVWAADMVREHLALAIPIRVGNDADLGAIAELSQGAAHGLSDAVFVYGGSVGLGAGIISGGSVFDGATGHAGELGHLTLQPRGARCSCGNRGCLETLAGLRTVLAACGLDEEKDGVDTRPALLSRLRIGDEPALRATQKAARWLAIGVASLINLLDPQAIVLGGWLGPAAEFLLPSLQLELSRRLPSQNWPPDRLRAGLFQIEAVARGAADRSLLDEVIADPMSFAA